jgi:plastocyanin
VLRFQSPNLVFGVACRAGARLTLAGVLALVGFWGAASADTILDQSSIVELPTVAAPSTFSFTATATEALTLTLTDFQTPAAFTSLQVAVTQNDTLVGSAVVDSSHMASMAIAAVAGNVYVLNVIGTPDTTQGYGSFGACVTRNSDTTPGQCVAPYSFSGNLETPSTPSNNGVSTLDTSFTATSTGTYQVTLTDDAFPVALQSVSATLFNGATQVGGIIGSGAPTPATLTGGTTYSLLVAAQAAAAPQAGLYGVHITDPSGAVVFDRTLPVGSLGASTVVNNTSAQALTLSLMDFAYPAPLASLQAAVTSGGLAALGELNAPGTLPNVMAPEGRLEIWQYASAGASPGVYSLSLASATANLLSTTQVVNPGGNASSGSFAFVVNLPAAGTYNLSVSDFSFPVPFQSLSSTIAQNGAPLTVDSTGNFTVTAAGPAVVLVNATAPSSGGGIFAVTVDTTGASPQILLDQTQAVGGVFNTQVLTYGASGNYVVTLNDLGFPTLFQNLAVVVSQGNVVLGKIYGNGSFPIMATPGQYVLTFIATPGAQNYGLYSINIASAIPTVTFTASSATVTAGEAVTLTWSSQNATACTASGGADWTGPEPTSGSTAVAISGTEMLSLTCGGPGGTSAPVSVTVTAAPAASGSGGGGGSLGFASLWLLAAAVIARQRWPKNQFGSR